MMRSLVTLAWVVSLVGACVNVDRPGAVVDCEKGGTCTNRGSDASAGTEVRSSQDVVRNGDMDQGSLQDGSAFPILDVDTDGSSRAPDRVFDVTQNDARDAVQDIAQDVARDVATDQPVGPCWSAGSPVAAGTVCRFALPSALCDVAEVCDGVNAACPPDSYAPATTVCRAAKGDCDIAESCSGSGPDCPADAFLTAGEICRGAAGPCDLAESCSGTDPACPADGMAPAGTICHPSIDMNECDPAETCTGSSVSCPADVSYTRPLAPTGVAVAPSESLQATISWTAAPGATGYNVKRSITSGSAYTTQGSPPTTTDSSFVNFGLTGGLKYYYVVSSVNTIVTCESVPSPEVSVTPSGSCTPPAAPTVTAGPDNGQVKLTWTASTGATSYSVARSATTGTGYLSVATAITDTRYTDINVSNGTTYYYVVTASNGSCSSVNSVEVPAAPTCTPPVAPTNLVATPNNGSVALTWTASAEAVSYRVLRSGTSGSGYTLVGTSGTPSYTDASVTNGTTYYYVVTASNGLCNSVNSAQVPATPACTPPSKPTNLVATPGNGQIVLGWTPSTGGAISYQVLRSTTKGGGYTALATPTSASFTDTSLVNGTTYYYVVYANGSCPSAPSAEASATPLCTPPSAPALTATPGDAKVTLSWTASTGSSVSYVVERGTASGGPYTEIPNASLTTYTDSPLTNGTSYYYVIKATNGTCFSTSTERSATPVAACTLLAPTGVAPTAGNKQVTLTWVAATGASSYNIGRSTSTGSGYTSAGTVNAPTLTFVDTSSALVNDTKYYYVVSASNSTCTSANSLEVSATPTCVLPAVPTNVKATADNSNGHITVAWDAVPGATGYTVSRGPSASGSFTAVSSNQVGATFTDTTGLAAGTTYYYVVSASNAAGTCASVPSGSASAMSCSSPLVPGDVKATAGILRVTVSWTAPSGSPTSYVVKRKAGANGSFSTIGTPTASPYIDSGQGMTYGTTYYYTVAARNAGGACSSADSSAVSATPRSCTVASGNGTTGHPPEVGTLNGICYVTCDNISNWGCAGTDGRTITFNGVVLSCGWTPIPAAKRSGYNVIDVGPGLYTWAKVFWGGGAYVDNCAIPSGGLDF